MIIRREAKRRGFRFNACRKASTGQSTKGIPRITAVCWVDSSNSDSSMFLGTVYLDAPWVTFWIALETREVNLMSEIVVVTRTVKFWSLSLPDELPIRLYHTPGEENNIPGSKAFAKIGTARRIPFSTATEWVADKLCLSFCQAELTILQEYADGFFIARCGDGEHVTETHVYTYANGF